MNDQNEVYEIIRRSAILTILGTILSGPVGTLLSFMIRPQPAWVNVDTFIKNYHPIQSAPFVFGFFLILGFSLFISSTSKLASSHSEKIYSILAIIFTSMFATIIGINYIIQIAFVPTLIGFNNNAISIFTMTNPRSLCWVFEMFGYGFLGVATWLVAPLFKNGQRMKYIRYLLVLNGIVSLLAAAYTAIDISMLMTIPGLISYVIWNLLIIVLMWLVYLEFR